MSPPSETPESEKSTRQRPATQTVAPRNCVDEYLVLKKYQVRIIANAIVQQSNNVTLVIDVNAYALLTAKYQVEVNL